MKFNLTKVKCVVCGTLCRAADDDRMESKCVGCHLPFHKHRCGVSYACARCLATLPPDVKKALTRRIGLWQELRAAMQAVLAFPGPLFILIGLFILLDNMSHGIMSFPVVLLLGLGLAALALVILILSKGKMRKYAYATFEAHPVAGAERRMEPSPD